MGKCRSFIMKYEECYSKYNNGKSGKQRRASRRLGEKIIRNKLKREIDDYSEYEKMWELS